MNTSGWIRGMMSKSMSDYDFFNHVAECMAREFEEETTTVLTTSFYAVSIKGYTVIIERDLVSSLRIKGAFSLDRYIYERLEEKGFKIDKERSQYIRYCFGVFYKRDDGSLY